MKALALSLVLLLGACAPSATDPPVEGPGGAGAAQLLGPWSPTPFRAPPAILARVDDVCRNFQRDADMGFRPGLVPVVVDVRGGRVAQIWYASPNGDTASCQDVTIDQIQDAMVLGGGSSGVGGGPQGAVAPDSMVIGDVMAAGDPVEKSYIAGRVGADIVRVQVEQPGRVPIVATIGRGWFAVWFPGEWARVGTDVVAYDSLGIEQAREQVT